MPYKKRQSRRPTGYKRKPYRKSKMTKGVSLAVKRFVKRTVHRNIENKSMVFYGANININTAQATTPIALNCIPTQSVGTSNSTRIGNEITLVKSYVKGYVNLLPINSVSNPVQAPLWVRIWLASSKTINTNLISSTDVASSFFNTGASVSGFQGTMLDMLLPINKDSWTVHAVKTFRLGLTGAYNSSAVGIAYPDNSNMSKSFYFDLRKFLKSPLKYNDGTSVCTNKNMFLIFQAVNADGSASAITPAEYHYTMEHIYEDA